MNQRKDQPTKPHKKNYVLPVFRKDLAKRLGITNSYLTSLMEDEGIEIKKGGVTRRKLNPGEANRIIKSFYEG